ncbi:uncharacterized protein LOC123662453 [Melitaea cinxia]|uniref:uncharacterized protein LOC123662453 n=1 Tax=Melitaea cinxia TaxID=113334 RepID=UPI001E2717CB|nr:uncharacterized protein LOC123662453 [Melitaea cinxia]
MRFLGQWFVNRRTRNPTFSADCATIDFIEGNNVTNLNIRGVNQNFLEEASGNAVHQSGSARFTVTVNSQTSDFSIIMTDYSNYAIGYSCENEGNQSNVYLWVLGRTSNLPTVMMEALINQTLIRLFDVTLNDLSTIDHSELACRTLPEIPSGQPIVLPGQCDEDMPVVQNFNVSGFVGTWHQIASYYTVNQLGTCNRAQYSLSGTSVAVTNSEVVNQTLSTVSGSATLASNDSSARLLVTLEVLPGVNVPSSLWILATDYTNYAISYTCVNLENNQRRVNSWILSRTKQLNSQAEAAVDSVIRSNLDLNNRFFIQSNQSDEACFYYPEPAPNTPVVFRGQCDPNIPAMPSFNATRYLGLWHNIESYPSNFQPGTCNNALYEASGNLVTVYNTQVINQRLDTIRGNASVVSTDGSARLLVVFPDLTNTSLTVQTNYWVLDTDYESYSLVYSCENINDDERRVFSWKLSRTKQMPDAGTAAINNIISRIPVLDQRYFEINNQSREGCFYYPDPEPGVPVRFPGQCDNTIPVTTNFSLSQFAGTWYEIEAYPKEQQPGQCISHEFTVNSGTFNLVTSSVSDQFLEVTNSVASLDSNDSNARMTITIRSGNTDITIPYWILATDYTNYALAYSCVNDGNDFQMIYSWKLSRTRQLSLQSSTEINNVMSEVTVLEQKYYDDVDQSTSACFFLPEIPPGQPVILSGQCDPNITVVQNFRAADYLGNWRLIESYASEFQNGTCIEATYNLQSDGSVEVVNTQVINQTLLTEIGSAVLASNDSRGILRVTFPSASTEIDYYILDTDYTSYSLVYSCVNVDAERRRVWSWKLSRTRNLTPTAIENMNNIINGIEVLNNRYYQLLDQSDPGCFYFPTPEPNRPVVFRGQCDPTINVVNDFNAADYLGLWYNIESYPSEFQSGTCNNALYTLRGDVVDVYNTQVINETLDTIHGVARLSEAANVAKLDVTFPVVGTNLTIETPYWVLATDYTNYSLVYTCSNIDSENFRVWSWKLSRTKQLTPAAVTAINNVVNTIPVLNDQYYTNNDQSVEGCFYYPEPEPGLPVVFPGQCDQNIQAVPNFNLSSFAGTWYEIQAYPKEQQTGQCINHTYTAGSANTLNLVSSSVTAQNLNTTNSVVRFNSTQDTSGKLVISLTGTVEQNNGITFFVDIDIPFWVLETNYNDFALAYSCVNINETFRSVYSWKLSRTQTLSPAANTAINTRIDQIDVLNNTYYEDIDQSDNACFYLPEPTDNEPVEFVGQCDETIPVVQNFNISAYMGRWRLIQSYPQASQTGTCSQANYNINSQGLVDVFNTQVLDQQLTTASGSAAPATNDGSGKFLVTFPNSTEPAPYWVLDTDYTSFALVYSCRNLPNNRRRVTSWKLSRTPELTPNATQRINQTVNSINVLNDRYYSPINQTDQACFYLPTPDPTRPVTFRGQCDENIPVVTTFNPAAYLDLWYNIESYPSEFQPGTCNKAFYSLRDGVVDVYNTQVINETLDTIHGTAILTGPANIAKLNVTFPVVGTNLTVETPYWVLATDYTNYSLVYTCINVDEEHQRVWSWKLSRTKQLTPAAVTAINNVVNTIPVLNDQYYTNNDQSVEGCFYYPEPEPGLPVVFPGQCDQNIQAVPNFNLSSFAGTWYEIQAYPKEQQTGQCINHTYTAGSANTLNLVSSSVTAQNLSTTNSVVRFNSTQDTSGKLVISLTGTDIDIPFWVLETNYNDFALAYSCVNINETFRSVYSWKLSRTQTLSPAANTAINTRIDQIDVLNNTYYEDIDQSDDACFFLPNLNPGEPIIFNGQCDPNIPVVQNFRPQDYTGRWRMIETYPSEFQSLQSTCSDALYTLNSNGIVDVYNTQVINQTLDTINGTATLATTDGSAKLLVNFPNAPAPSDYWILDTDYTSFALVYSCLNISNLQRRVWTWKLSRTRELTAAANTRINQVMSGINVLDQRYYINIDHSDNACFYYPVADGNPLVFRGQCDENITVVTNFNAQAYLGTWYDIESYPVQFQDGTCPTATYTSSTTGVDVFNTQVVGQQLDTIEGSAVLATDDGQAKLTVTFPIAGTNLTTSSPYWVLSTDYNNYALVYSCVNIDNENRRVSSWKLSRERSLSQTSVTTINNIINSIPVLRQDYYVTRGHNETDCFYYPDNNGGPVLQNGQCNFNNLNIVTNFNTSLFSGPWYEVSRFPSELQEGECVSNEFIANNQNLSMTMTIVSGESQSIFSGSATLQNNNQGILDVNLVNSNGETFQTRFYVLDVDYNDYALLYNCREINATSKQVYSWKLSRSQTGLSSTAVNAINNIVSNTEDLFEGYYDDTDQTVNGCFHYPEFDQLPPSIELLGPCDESITAKSNFNVEGYLGRWYEIASYPQAFQEGTCARAEYTLRAGFVNVFNSQVVNRTLDVQTATAVVASTDGSGLLNVTFQLSNVTNVVNYYVLETDYNTFALVYSCRTLPSGNRQVTSWQLSRTPTMPPAALPIINNIINSTQGLNQDYYQPTDQSPEACFYIPNVNRNETPRFRGQCENIQGVQGFDIQRFVGWWHEVESYPSDYDRGTCYSSEVIQSGNNYIMVDTGIFDTRADVNTSTLTADSNGRLTKTGSNGQTTDVWVLATDYETYALLYSCENDTDEYRRIWSAKYSKTRELSASAQNAMSSVIQATETLEPQFYLPANLSDEACFYYPEQTGNQIILPGQCDTNITVVQNFNPAEYSGTWYQIQRYPQIHENGTCVGARYTLDENTGVVTVLNWQVTNGVLDTVEGTATVNSTDGSAKLLVTLPIRNTDAMVSMELYVLTTDYTSYALAYSCVNIGPYRRAIGAWKLSRTRSLTTAGNNSINEYMNTREELFQNYFQNVEQNDDCDEPSSAVLFRSSIIILLICSILHRLL